MKKWRMLRLKNLCIDVGQYGLGVPSEAYAESGVRLLRTTDISSGVMTPNGVGVFIGFTPEARFILRNGDLLLSRSGTPPGQSYLVRPEDDGMTFAGYLVRFRPRADTDPRFLAYVAQSAGFQHTIQAEAVASTIQNFNAERYANMRVVAPDLDEQCRIASFLDGETMRIDRLMSIRRRQLDILSERRLAYASGMAEKLLNNYGYTRLRHVLLSIQQGWSPQCEDRLTVDGEWGVVRAGCVNGGVFDKLQHKALPTMIEPRREYQLRSGDLLMSRANGSPDLIGSVGIVHDLDANLLLCDKVYRLKLDRTRMTTAFVAHMLRSHRVRERIKLGISGAAGMANNLPIPVVKDCVIPDAPLGAQGAVVEELEHHEVELGRLRSVLEHQIALLAERRQALITAAVTGQLDVTTARPAYNRGL